MKRTLIHNATIVNEGQSVQGSVVIENGRIAEVLTNWKPLSAPCEEVIDATGSTCCPALSTTMCIFVIRVLPIRQIF